MSGRSGAWDLCGAVSVRWDGRRRSAERVVRKAAARFPDPPRRGDPTVVRWSECGYRYADRPTVFELPCS